MNDTIHVKGLADLGRALQEFPIKFERNVLRGALRAGMKPVRVQARANVVKQSGVLAKGLKVSTSSRGKMVYSKLKTSGAHDYIARFIEFGTARHWISAKNGGMLRIAGTNAEGGSFVTFKQRVDHKGSRALPFMRPALDTQATNAVTATGEYIRGRLTEQGINIQDAGDE